MAPTPHGDLENLDVDDEEDQRAYCFERPELVEPQAADADSTPLPGPYAYDVPADLGPPSTLDAIVSAGPQGESSQPAWADPESEVPSAEVASQPVDEESEVGEEPAVEKEFRFEQERQVERQVAPTFSASEDALGAGVGSGKFAGGPRLMLDRLPELAPPEPWLIDAAMGSDGAAHDAARASSDPSHLMASLAVEATPVTTGDATMVRVQEMATQRIRRASALAARGAQFAARLELLASLRTLTQATDKRLGSAERSADLANGLRALDEAKDFLAQGTDLDAELDVATIAASHRAPIAKAKGLANLMPQEAADLYYRYAQKALGRAVSDSPAGSMALYSLGKLHSQLEVAEPDQHPDAQRRAFAFQQAALAARSDNDMAAHELGVLMAEAGHLAESAKLLEQVAARRPHPTAFRNLANVQRRLGDEQAARTSEVQAATLSSAFQHEDPVQWMAPAEFARTAQKPTGAGISQ